MHLADGTELAYDVLVVATGAVLAPEETEGLNGPGWMEKVFTFYTLEGASALEEAFTSFDGGRVVVNVVEMPIKCPVAPLEFCFLADWFFHEQGIRDRVELTYVTPLDGAFTKPAASEALGGMLAERDIELVTEFNTGSVDGSEGKLVSWDDREILFDLAVVIPVHNGAAYVGQFAWPWRRARLRADRRAHAPVQGRARTCSPSATPPRSRSPRRARSHISRARYSSRTSAGSSPVRPSTRPMTGTPTASSRPASHKAMLIDFNYETEPLPGHFPGPVGLPLLKESRLNHLGKLMFQWLYWHSLLPGRDIPGITSAMPNTGKHQSVPKLKEAHAP